MPIGANWKYLDNGSDQGTAWRGTNFDDRAWASGPAQLGYGEGDESTILSFGPDANNKYVTTYFRCPIFVPAIYSVTNLHWRLLRDDGAIIYLNGVEVFRSNMPTGAVDYLTFASAVVGDVDETTFFATNASSVLPITGSNIIAVELHQANLISSDLSFDLEVAADFGPPPPPRLRMLHMGNSLLLYWPTLPAGFQLQGTSNLVSNWSAITNKVTITGGNNTVGLAASFSQAFYRLSQ